MEFVEVSRKVPKESHEVGVAVRVLLEKIGEARADGKVDPAEILPIIGGSLDALNKAIDGAAELANEVPAHPGTASSDMLAEVGVGLDALLGKSVPSGS